jgi:CBS domain-containing protein
VVLIDDLTARPALTGRTVGDVMVRRPKTMPVDTSVARARACFVDEHVHMLLLTECGRLIGTLVRADLPPDVDGADPALAHSRLTGRTSAADVPAESARQFLLAHGQRRLAVVDADGTLLGLLCLKRRRTGFCTDADVAARAAEDPPRTAWT